MFRSCGQGRHAGSVSAAERLYEGLGGKESGVQLNLVDGAAHLAHVQKSRGCNDQAVTFGSCWC
jgi:hypothetical protein